MRLRTKIILALLLCSLASVALVGFVAQQRLMRKFDTLIAERASRSFRDDVRAYIETYGSWQAGQAQEGFRSFAERRRERAGLPPNLGLPPAGTPPPDNIETPPATRVEPRSLEGRPPPPSNLARPPFRFLLFDASGRSMMRLGAYEEGDLVREEDRVGALPVTVRGEAVAYAVPKGIPNYSDLDLGYVTAIREALLLGAGLAAVLALALGVLLATRLSASLRRLTDTIGRLQQGELGLQVPVNSRDEVGELGLAFNRMSAELAESHEALRASHARVAEQAQVLQELAVRDALTRLHNRRHFDEQAGVLCGQAARNQQPMSIMIGDIDHFKQINDRLSHAVGDEVLRQVGEILRQNTRSTDLVARYGGEEFVIAFPDTPLAHAHALCDKLRTAIAAYAWSQIHAELHVTISIGVAMLRREDDLGSVMRMADEQLYRAKSAGRDQVCAAV